MKALLSKNMIQRIIFLTFFALCMMWAISVASSMEKESSQEENETSFEEGIIEEPHKIFADKVIQAVIHKRKLEEEEAKKLTQSPPHEKEQIEEISDEEQQEEKTVRTLDEILATPETSTIGELIPYLQGDFETNVELLAHLGMGEARGGPDVVFEAQYAVATIRAFDPSASNGTGDLESAIFYKLGGKYQYTCVKKGGGFYLKPDEQCYRTARAFLNGELIEPERNLTSFFIAPSPIKGKTIEKIYEVPDWRTSDPDDTMNVYVCSKW